MGYAPRLCITIEVVVKRRRRNKRCTLHRLFYNLRHLEERASFLTESEVDNFIGRIHDTGHRSATAQGFKGKGEATELVKVGTLKGKVGHLIPVQTVE